MADQAKEWSVSSNDAMTIKLKHRADSNKDVEFRPLFTYPIFGNEEIIYGYQKLQIVLEFQGDTLQANLKLSWKDKIPEVGDTKADDIEGQLKDFLPTVLGDQKSENAEQGAQSSRDAPFQPPGKRIHSYSVNDQQYGIWAANLTDPLAKRILRRMQIFTSINIEGGSFIELDDPDWTIERWTIYFLYALYAQPSSPQPIYSLAGYSTSYRLFFLDTHTTSSYLLTPPSSASSSDSSPNTDTLPRPLATLQSTIPSRSRISQFIILPPYQRTGHGSHLYTTMLVHALADPTVRELTVEDPNESFDDLRDLNDLLHLRSHYPAFRTLSINTALTFPPAGKTRGETPLPTTALLDQPTLADIRHRIRLETRQFHRLVEMQTLSNIPPLHRSTKRITRKDRASDPLDKAYYLWRLLVKQRLTKHNADALVQLELEERLDKLEDALASVEVGYAKTLERCEGRVAVIVHENDDDAAHGVDGTHDDGRVLHSAATNGSSAKRGREEHNNGAADVLLQTPRRKRVRVVGSDSDE